MRRAKLLAALLGYSILLGLPVVWAVSRAPVENQAATSTTTQATLQNGAMTLWHGQPAPQWDHATPVGNGRLGAMIFGHTSRERIQLNEETLWSGAWKMEKAGRRRVKTESEITWKPKPSWPGSDRGARKIT